MATKRPAEPKIPAPPAHRNAAVDELVGRIDSGEVVALDLSGARLITPRHPIPDDDRVCIVCGCALQGTQEELCWGHWDYLRIEGIDPDQPYVDFLEQLRIWLAERASGLRVETVQIEWAGAANRNHCDVCGKGTTLYEQLVNDRGEILKRHFVCADHRSFRDDRHRRPRVKRTAPRATR